MDNNRLLASFATSDLSQLRGHMQHVELKRLAVIFEPNQPITHVYFPLTGIVSLHVIGSDGAGVEAAVIGNEGVVGLGGLLAGDVSFTRQFVHLAGEAVRIARAPFLAGVDGSRQLRAKLAAHADAFTSQLIQSAACHAQHSAEERLARWLLTTSDRSGQQSLPFTHNELAEMLGVQRPTVTLAARFMQSAGLIDYRRGSVTIINRSGLVAASCECYGIIRRTYDRALLAE